MSDPLLYEQSTATQGTSEPFISRQVVQVLDQNGGNYNGQIQIDTSSLSNSGKYASYGEAYLVIPCVTVLTPESVATTATNLALYKTQFNDAANNDASYSVGMKNGYHQLIHSLSVSYNNSDVVQLTPYTNFYVQFKLLTQLSWEDVKKIGPGIGFHPDSSDSYHFSRPMDGTNAGVISGSVVSAAVGTVKSSDGGTGLGVRNNRNFGDIAAALTTNPAYNNSNNYNKGLLQRQLDSAYNYASTTDYTADGQYLFLPSSYASDSGKNYYSYGTDYKVWYTLAKIRLKDLHSFFDQLPLVKGAFLSLRINTNTATHKIVHAKAATNTMAQYCSQNIITGGTSPLILASAESKNGFNSLYEAVKAATAVLADSYTLSLRISIGKDASLGLGHPTWGNQVRLFVPMYQMSPIDEEKYLTINRTKRVVYEDIYNYQVNVDNNSTFNQLLTNGIPNPVAVITVPFLSNASNYIGLTATSNGTYPFQSPWASEPGNTSPLVYLKDYNVQVAGINMFTQNQVYDFEQFQNELSSFNAINGNLVNGLTSGLISEYDFYHSYRYYVCNVARRLPAEDSVPKSISIMGKNTSNFKVSLFVFVVFRREITIDLATGQKLD
jgi:hypothetical protein